MIRGSALVQPRWLAVFLPIWLAGCVDGLPTEMMPDALEMSLQFAVVTSSDLSSDEEDALRKAFDSLDQIRVTLFRPGESVPFVDTLIAVTPGQESYFLDILVSAEDVGEFLDVELVGSAGGVQLFASSLAVMVKDPTLPAGTADQRSLISIPIRYIGPGLAGVILDPDGGPAVGLEVELLQGGQVVQTAITGGAGSYLFTDLQAGTYTVQVRLAAGLVSCPASRDIGPLTASSVVAGGFKLTRTNCALKILVLSGGDVDDNGSVIGALSAQMPEASFGSEFVVVSPPSLGSLLPYDAVVLYENGSYDHAAAVGDRIAEYVEAGGNLVIGSFYWQNRSDAGRGHPGWGNLEGMDAFSSTGGAVYGQGSLGDVSPHEITQGVSAFSVSRWWGGVSANGGTSVVASWADGTPLAGYAVGSGGQRIVAISAFPGLMGGGGGGLAKLWGNAVRWAASAGGPSSGAVQTRRSR